MAAGIMTGVFLLLLVLPTALAIDSHFCPITYRAKAPPRAEHDTVSCGWWGWSRCGRTRYFEAYQAMTNTQNCCHGYRGSACNIPVCEPACANREICVRPDVCECPRLQGGATCTTSCNFECSAGCGAPNEVASFDGFVSTMDSGNKFLISTFQPTSADVCKFQVRIDTAEEEGQFKVDWMGVAFGVHKKNSAKFERNFRVSLTDGVIEARGRGYNGPGALTFPPTKQCIETDSLTWYLCAEELTGGNYLITAGRVDGSCWIEVTYLEDAATNDKAIVRVSDNYKGLLEGQCGDYNGDPIGDDGVCTNTYPGSPQPCVDGERQNN